jgi:uncharacterized protein with HEPN domain
MAKDDRLYLGHMLDAATEAKSLVESLAIEQFMQNRVLRLAVAHLLQNVGEAARCVSPEFRAQHPDIPWNQITGMRHRVVHRYFEVNDQIVWATATTDLAPLIQQLRSVITPPPPPAAAP